MAERETVSHTFPFPIVTCPQSRNPLANHNDYLVIKYNITDSSAISNGVVNEVVLPDQEYSNLLDTVMRDTVLIFCKTEKLQILQCMQGKNILTYFLAEIVPRIVNMRSPPPDFFHH